MGRQRIIIATVLAIGMAFTAVGCAGRARADIVTARAALDAGNYQEAYDVSSRVLNRSGGTARHEAAYLAGLSAYRLKRFSEAEELLTMAASTNTSQLRGKSMAMLGLVYIDGGRLDVAARTLSKAAEFLTGQDRANAYFYAAVASQRLNRPAEARTLMMLAARYNVENDMGDRITQALRTTGYTIQIGIFADAAQARAAGERLLGRSQSLGIGYPRVEHRKRADGQVIHLLQIGRFSTFNAAAAKRHELGINDAVIVVLHDAR